VSGAAGTGIDLGALTQEQRLELARALRDAEADEDRRKIIEDRKARREREWEDRLKGISRREQPWLLWRGALLKGERVLLKRIELNEAVPPGETLVERMRREEKVKADRETIGEIHNGSDAPQFGGLRGSLHVLGITVDPTSPNKSLRHTEKMLAMFADERAKVEKERESIK
jgi:hypothetical protein